MQTKTFPTACKRQDCCTISAPSVHIGVKVQRGSGALKVMHPIYASETLTEVTVLDWHVNIKWEAVHTALMAFYSKPMWGT